MEVTRSCVEILLRRRIGISLSTRGIIPEDIVALLGRHASQVQIPIPLVSLSRDYTTIWEPGTAAPEDRLFLIQRLLQVGIKPRIRIEPLIPFANDHTDQLRGVVSAIAGLGLTEATLGFLHLRPGVEEQIKEEAPVEIQRLLLGCFPPPTEHASPFQHLPRKLRLASLHRIQRISREYGLKVSACHCQNPGIPAGRCPIVPPELPRTRKIQGDLFS